MERPRLLRAEGPQPMSSRLRCAIYTRKSSEEGLEQNFNSLHAQREACEAYILSQTGEGWSAMKAAYDDGGYSGGSMERPGLKQLMTDITHGLVDIVVVYKVDRLTRSLADFAKIVELFDAKGVSFVSVTQAFNTTSSMGRLTLNVLLSFAQFEREVTGERIRDKVAASKAKGLRMGGQPPLGYDIVEGRLAIHADEATRVRAIFQRYLELGSIHALEQEGVPAKRWVNKAGREAGGGLMSRGALNYLLRNPAYRGITRHKEKLYPGTHPAILDENVWDAAQAKLDAAPSHQPSGKLIGGGALLAGKVFDDRQNPMVAVHTKRGAKRYRYYLSRARLTRTGEAGSLPRISAGMLEQFLAEELAPLMSPAWRPEAEEFERISAALATVTLSEDQILARLCEEALRPDAAADRDAMDGLCAVRLPFQPRRRQGALILDGEAGAAPRPGKMDRALVRGLVLAKTWSRQLEAGEVASIKAIAAREGLCNHYTSRLLPLAYLAPDLADDILNGRQHRGVTLAALTAQPLPMEWGAQRDLVNRLGGAVA
ncbi:MAG: recombinase family protein [Phenylobacterium sp.]|nr:MAG: recombinase family protein [Phenylobacterium sp.]